MAKRFIALKREVYGIQDIKETVKALEKISAANLHYLKITSQRMAEYEKKMKEIFVDVLDEIPSSPLFKKTTTNKRLDIVLTAEKGLCGDLLNKLSIYFKENFKKGDDVLVIGEEGKNKIEEMGIRVNYFFAGEKDIPKEKDIRDAKKLVLSRFLDGKYNEILIFWMGFKNFGLQIPKMVTFLPIDKVKFRNEIGEKFAPKLSFPIYEPNKESILNYLLEEYLESVFYQKVLEAKLSELSARTLAMEESSEKADNLIKKLNLLYFKEKRAMITKEISDLFSHRVRRAGYELIIK